MPKSKHGRGKHPHKNKIRQRPVGGETMQAAAAAPAGVQPAVTPAATPARPAAPAVPAAKAATLGPRPRNATPVAIIDAGYVKDELKRIGILTAIVVVALIILAIIFR